MFVSFDDEAMEKLGVYEIDKEDGYSSTGVIKGDKFEKLLKLRLQIDINGITWESRVLRQDLESDSYMVRFEYFYPAKTGPMARDVNPQYPTVEGYSLMLPDDPEVIDKLSIRFVLEDEPKEITQEERKKILKELFGNIPEYKKPKLELGEIPAVYIKKTPEALFDQYGRKITKKGKLALSSLVLDKAYNLDAINYLGANGFMGALITELVIRDRSFTPRYERLINNFYSKIKESDYEITLEYLGLPEQYASIATSIKESEFKEDDRRKRSGNGAGSLLELNLSTNFYSRLIGDTPVLVIGGGPAGIFAARGLVSVGFNPGRVYVLDNQGEYGGIWNQKNVNGASKNNPFKLEFDRLTLEPAPGPGKTVSDFLDSVADLKNRAFPQKMPGLLKATVVGVEPGDLNHKVIYKVGQTGAVDHVNMPIVINTIGVGKPLEPSREGYMTTNAKNGEAGIRWQQVITPEQAEKLRGKTLALVGFGNSTAEMLVSLSEYNRKGYKINYRVITHFPKEALDNPSEDVKINDKTYHVFRDTSIPTLTRLTGDLSDIRSAYFEALYRGKVIPGVIDWQIKDNTMTTKSQSGEINKFKYDQLYTLIGFGHDPDILRKLGMHVVDEYTGAIAYDYDGEIQRQPGIIGRDRIHPGYFGLGAVLKTPENPNASVIPGMMHQLYDLLFSAVIRAVEHQERERPLQRLQLLYGQRP